MKASTSGGSAGGTAGDLTSKSCKPCEAGTPPLGERRVRELLAKIPGWDLTKPGEIGKTYRFKNYYETMAFVSAIAWVSHRENHHPNLEVGYDQCRIRYSTHSVGGLSENDFICAAKVDALVQSSA
jgi:4a-hydroxytetrahydrobiopterin dehydratase